jgi:hypothetical protein
MKAMKTVAMTMLWGLAIVAMIIGCRFQDATAEELTMSAASVLLDEDLPLSPFDDTVKAYSTRSRSIIKSAYDYQFYIGHQPPPWIDFTEVWVVFATTGTTPTDGYEMHIDRMRFFTESGYNLYPYFREVAPGPGCHVNNRPSQANALATFPIPPARPRRTRFQNTYDLRTCTGSGRNE